MDLLDEQGNTTNDQYFKTNDLVLLTVKISYYNFTQFGQQIQGIKLKPIKIQMINKNHQMIPQKTNKRNFASLLSTNAEIPNKKTPMKKTRTK